MKKVVPSIILLTLYYGIVSLLSQQSNLPPLPVWKYLDNVIHYLEYIPIGFLSFRIYYYYFSHHGLQKLFLSSLATGLVLGGIDEYHQSFVVNREASMLDWSADGLGVVTGILCYHWGAPFLRLWRRMLMERKTNS